MTRTIGEGSLIGITFQLWYGGLCHRQFDRHRRAKSGTLADGAHLSAIGSDEGIGNPQAKARTAGGRGMAFAACETIPDLCLFYTRQSGALVSDADDHATVICACGNRDPRGGCG